MSTERFGTTAHDCRLPCRAAVELVSHLPRHRSHLPTAGVAVIELPQWSGFDRSTQLDRIEVWHPDET